MPLRILQEKPCLKIKVIQDAKSKIISEKLNKSYISNKEQGKHALLKYKILNI